MSQLFSYFITDEEDITLCNAKRIIFHVLDERNELGRALKKEVELKNKMYAFLIAKGLMDEFDVFKDTSIMTKAQAINVFAHSLD